MSKTSRFEKYLIDTHIQLRINSLTKQHKVHQFCLGKNNLAMLKHI